MSPNDVPVSTEPKNGVMVLKVGADEIGLEEIESFGARLMQVVNENLGKTVVLDLGEVVVISSVVIGKLFRARKLLLDSDGELVIVAPDLAVRAKLGACDLDRILRMYKSLEEALDAVRSA